MTERPQRIRLRAVRLTPAELAADAWAEKAIDERLTAIRSAASDWGKAVATIAGLLGAGSLLNADTAVRALKPNADIAYAVLAALAFVTAVAAVTFASLAASPRRRLFGPDVGSRQTARAAAFTRASRLLFASRITTGLAVTLLLASFGVRWFAPT